MTKFLKGISYHGSSHYKNVALAPLWNEFTRQYTDNAKKHEYAIETANFLDELAFQDTPIPFLISQRDKLKKRIENISEALSEVLDAHHTDDHEKMRPLNRAVQQSLIKKWIVLEQCFEQKHTGVSHRIERDSLRKTPEGALLYAALLNSSLNTLKAHSKETQGMFPKVDYEDIFHQAEDIFDTALSSYRLDHNNEFASHLQTALGYLSANIARLEKRKAQHGRNHVSTDDEDVPSSSSAPLDGIIERETEQRLPSALVTMRKTLNTALDERQRTIVKQRYGFFPDQPIGLKEIGERFGLTKERTRQIASQSLRIIREDMGTSVIDEEDDSPNSKLQLTKSSIRKLFEHADGSVPYQEITAATNIYPDIMVKLVGHGPGHITFGRGHINAKQLHTALCSYLELQEDGDQKVIAFTKLFDEMCELVTQNSGNKTPALQSR